MRLKPVLEGTVDKPAHVNLDKTNRMTNAVMDVKNHKVWHAFYVLCGVGHGPMLTLRYSDASELGMDKVFYWSYPTCMYIKENEDEINAVELFAGDGSIDEDGGFDEELNMFFQIAEKGNTFFVSAFGAYVSRSFLSTLFCKLQCPRRRRVIPG